MRGSQQGLESRASRLMTPPKGLGSGGNCFSDFRDVVPAAEHGSDAGCCANAPAAANIVNERAVSVIRRTPAVLHLPLIVPLLKNEMYLSSIEANSLRLSSATGSAQSK